MTGYPYKHVVPPHVWKDPQIPNTLAYYVGWDGKLVIPLKSKPDAKNRYG